MASIKLRDAAFWYGEHKHQKEAWDFLEQSLHKELLDEFARRYRNEKAPNYLVDLPQPGVDLIKEFEGCHLKAYYDPLSGGLPITIGWGSTKKMDGSPFFIGDKVTQQEADELFYKQLKKEYLPPLTDIPYWNEVNDNQRGALLSFAYNLGAHFYGGKNFSTITFVLKHKQWDRVPEVMYMYRNPGTRVETGLGRRRKAEGYLWELRD